MDRKRVVSLIPIAIILLAAGGALASSAGMPWEGPLNRLLQSLTGPVAKAIGVFAIIGLGFGIAFSEGGSGLRKALWVGHLGADPAGRSRGPRTAAVQDRERAPGTGDA